MQINKLEDTAGTLLKLEFIQGDGTTFKNEIKAYLIAHFPEMTFQQFFEKLIEYYAGKCTINMQ